MCSEARKNEKKERKIDRKKEKRKIGKRKKEKRKKGRKKKKKENSRPPDIERYSSLISLKGVLFTRC
jgi:hypothetical protein